MAAFEGSRITLKLRNIEKDGNDKIKLDRLEPHDIESLQGIARLTAGNYLEPADNGDDANALVLREEVYDYLPDRADLQNYYCLRAIVDEILIDGKVDKDFFDVFKLAANGKTIIDNYYDPRDDNPIILIFTQNDNLDNGINSKDFDSNEILFAQWTYNSWHHITNFIEDSGGIFNSILNVMRQITDANSPIDYEFNNKASVNQTVISLQNSFIDYNVPQPPPPPQVFNKIETQLMKPPQIWVLKDYDFSKRYNVTNIKGGIVMQGRFNDIYAEAKKENAQVADDAGNLIIELGGKIKVTEIPSPGVASATNKKSKKTKKTNKSKTKRAKKSKTKKAKKSNKIKKSKAKKSKKVKSKKK